MGDNRIVLSGFYRCPKCQKIHTYSPSFPVVNCECGSEIFQFDTTQGGGR